MKKIEDIELTQNDWAMYLKRSVWRNSNFTVFNIPLENEEMGTGMMVNQGEWEHVLLDLSLFDRCPTYKEMSQLRDIFFLENEITLQVHPKQSEYVNDCLYALHLWRNKNTTASAEERLKRKICSAYEKARKYDSGERKEIYLHESHLVIIFCGKEWLSWEEVCKIKQRYWEPEEAAVQFNVSPEFDLNKERMILLWDASDFELPPKKLV